MPSPLLALALLALAVVLLVVSLPWPVTVRRRIPRIIALLCSGIALVAIINIGP